MRSRVAAFAASLIIVTGCVDAPTGAPMARSTASPTGPNGSSARDASAPLTVRWNRTAIALFRTRGGNAGRLNAYLPLAQYRAVLAAQDERHGRSRPSPAGAVAGASAVVLTQFFPLDVAAINASLAAQRAESPLGRENNSDFAAGEAIGREVAAAVLAFAASDNIGLTSPGTPPVGNGYWVSSGAPIVLGGFGARPFYLASTTELRLPPPPAFGSDEYRAALKEVRAISDARTVEQLTIAQKWAPFSGVVWNGVATDLLEKYHLSELESARILAYAGTAAFDAQIACFDTKFFYWFIRPPKADPGITTPVGMPNHPSYPSAHSCDTGAWEGILADAFPSERRALAAVAQEASMSRMYAGIHYRFDGEGGLAIGRAAARLALQRRGLE